MGAGLLNRPGRPYDTLPGGVGGSPPAARPLRPPSAHPRGPRDAPPGDRPVPSPRHPHLWAACPREPGGPRPRRAVPGPSAQVRPPSPWRTAGPPSVRAQGRVSPRPPPTPLSSPVSHVSSHTKLRVPRSPQKPLVPGTRGLWGQVRPRAPARGPAGRRRGVGAPGELPAAHSDARGGGSGCGPEVPAGGAALRPSGLGSPQAPLAGGRTGRQLPALSGPQSPHLYNVL